MTRLEQKSVVALRAKGWSYRRIGDKLGVSASTVRRWCAIVEPRAPFDASEPLPTPTGYHSEVASVAGRPQALRLGWFKRFFRALTSWNRSLDDVAV